MGREKEGKKKKQHTRLHRREDRSDARELGIKIARVGGTLDLRLKGRGDLLVPNVVPVDVAEEGVAHDFLRVRRARPQPQLGLPHQELLEDRDRIPRHVDRVERFVGQDGVVDFVFVFASEGGLLQEHLVDQDAERPPVDCTAVFLIKQNLAAS